MRLTWLRWAAADLVSHGKEFGVILRMEGSSQRDLIRESEP